MSLVRRTNPYGELLALRSAVNRLTAAKPRPVKIKATGATPGAAKTQLVEGRDR